MSLQKIGKKFVTKYRFYIITLFISLILSIFYQYNFVNKLYSVDLILKRNCSKSMVALHKKYNCSIMASIKVSKKNLSRWGIYSVSKKINSRNFLIDDVVNLSDATDKLVVALSLQDYQIIEKRKKNL